ncbi:MAG: YraN family protein, partial [Chitinophagaceae bacterium]
HSHYEIDLIALKEEKLHFIEVKMRSSKKFGLPEEGVTKQKFERLLKAADEFLFLHPQYKHVQYDVLAISCFKNEPVEFFYIGDVYF